MPSSRVLIAIWLFVACTGAVRLLVAEDGWGVTFAALTVASGLALVVIIYRGDKSKRQPHK